MAAFNSHLFNDRMDPGEVTDDISKGQVSREEYLKQRNRTILYMLKHDFTEEDLKDLYKLSDEEFREIVSSKWQI